MTPEEKGLELFYKHYKMWTANKADVIAHCLITVEEIISIKREFLDANNESEYYAYWQKVKQHIQAL